jgi:hypothetical protein
MTLILRKGEAADANAVGDICYRAFKAIAEQHNFTPDLPGADVAGSMLAAWMSHAGFFNRVAEIDGRIVGSNFLDERNPISGVGPVTVDPALQKCPRDSVRCRPAT